MEKEDKIRIAITAGIGGLILLILVLYIALSGQKKTGDVKQTEDTASQALSIESVSNSDTSGKGTTKDNSLESSIGSEEKTDDAALASTSQPVGTTDKTEITAKKYISGNSFYETKNAVLKNVYKKVSYDVKAQLSDLYKYFSDGNGDAIRDLVHLERYEAMSYSLSGSNNYYYYGETNEEGLPNGLGVAVYADDQYYFGNFENGVRSGNGQWYSFYPEYSVYVVKEHMYSGEWSGDLPNGQGQEHFDYDQKFMNKDDLYIQNAIGNFINGYYNGEMYIITVNNNYDTKEWLGTCDSGNWIQVSGSTEDKKGRVPALSERENEDNHIWLLKDRMVDNGIKGIISGGKQVQ
nr:hypothetical protein [uncultured Butyrivibrio sp.]